MTQLTFDFSTSTHSCIASFGFTSNASGREQEVSQAVSPRVAETQSEYQPARQDRRTDASGNRSPIHHTERSLSLYDSGRKELHHIGDLVHAVIDRYEIVHRRRAARIAREKAAREQADRAHMVQEFVAARDSAYATV